jgi:hypothetical protein
MCGGVFDPMRDDEGEATTKSRQEERWERAITLSILAVIASGILGVAAHDAFFHKRGRSWTLGTACMANLKTIDAAKATWALENHKTNSDIPTDADLFGATSYVREKPVCPAGGSYRLRAVDKRPRCSIPGHTI